jgi:hypothetical protein
MFRSFLGLPALGSCSLELVYSPFLGAEFIRRHGPLTGTLTYVTIIAAQGSVLGWLPGLHTLVSCSFSFRVGVCPPELVAR